MSYNEYDSATQLQGQMAALMAEDAASLKLAIQSAALNAELASADALSTKSAALFAELDSANSLSSQTNALGLESAQGQRLNDKTEVADKTRDFSQTVFGNNTDRKPAVRKPASQLFTIVSDNTAKADTKGPSFSNSNE